MKFLLREEVFKVMESKGYKIYDNDSRDLNLNIVGIRSKTAKLDEFGCQLLVAWKYKGVWKSRSYHITTYPGKTYLINRLLNPRGCAILCPGQYIDTYAVRLHNGKYRALCQTYGPVRVFRDRDRDTEFDLDPSTIMSGDFGINIHDSRDNQITLRVGSHSAGCQVFSDDKEFSDFMDLVEKSALIYKNKFTYTLIDEP